MNKQPKYYQAKLLVLNQINTLGLKKGDHLPSHGEFIRNADFSMICLRRALDELERDGIIARQQGKRACLVKDVCELPRRGEVLYLHIYSQVPDKSLEFERMRLLFNRHGINLSYASYGKPNPELLQMSERRLGVILTGWITREWVDFLKLLGLPLLVLGSNPFPDELPSVDCDWRAGTILAYQELARRGCRSIALLNSSKNYIPAFRFYDGFKEACRAAGRRFSEDMIAWIDIKGGGRCYHAIADFLKSRAGVDGVIVENGVYNPLMTVLYECESAGRLKVAAMSQKHFEGFSFSRQIFVTFKESVYLETSRIFLKRLESGNHSIQHFAIEPRIYNPQEHTP